MPATSFTANHPKITPGQAISVDASSFPPPQLSPAETWFATGSLFNGGYTPVSQQSGVAFMAYGYPAAYSSNTGYEAPNSMVTFLVQDSSCNSYLLALVDKDGRDDGSEGFVKLDVTTTGVSSCTDPVAFQNDPQSLPTSLDSYTWTSSNIAACSGGIPALCTSCKAWAYCITGTADAACPGAPAQCQAGGSCASYAPCFECGTGTVQMTWSTGNDGLVIGPLPIGNDWSVNLKVAKEHRNTRGLETFKIGTYDAYRNDIGFVTAPIQKATHDWGGLQYDGMECTTWCQRYTDCSSCTRDESCTFSSAHGGCVAADAYIYDYGCPRPLYAPITKVIHRDGDSYAREGFYDDFEAAFVMRYSLDSRIDMTCPCNTRYRFFATMYDADMKPIFQVDNVPVRLNYQHTFVDIPPTAGVEGSVYKIHSHVCVEQGTLARDDCSPVTIDEVTFTLNPPPPSPPPPLSP